MGYPQNKYKSSKSNVVMLQSSDPLLHARPHTSIFFTYLCNQWATVTSGYLHWPHDDVHALWSVIRKQAGGISKRKLALR